MNDTQSEKNEKSRIYYLSQLIEYNEKRDVTRHYRRRGPLTFSGGGTIHRRNVEWRGFVPLLKI